MKELIKITESEGGKKVVSARDLHEFLGLDKSQISRWLKSNIIENKFAVENEDYIGVDINVEGNNLKDYAITLNLAKKLSMVSKTKKGEDIRNYFIECERIAQAPKPLKELSRLEILTMAIEAEKKNIELEAEVKLLTPKAEYAEKHLLEAECELNTTEVAKSLFNISANKLNQELVNLGVIRKTGSSYILTAKYEKANLGRMIPFETKYASGLRLVWNENGRYLIKQMVGKKLLFNKEVNLLLKEC